VSRLANALREFLPAKQVLTDEESLHPYECDGLSVYRQMPLLAVLPETVDQVRDVMRVCRDQGVAVVSRGAGTGLSAGALPRGDAVLLSLARLNQILELDADACIARVQPGVRNLAISEAAGRYGLYYAPDPSSQIACSIGGNVAENAGGVHCLKYGLTVHNVIALKVITADGELLQLGDGALDQPGYDFLALMTGSEGMLGVVVEVTVRLLPRPPAVRVLLAAFREIHGAARAVGDIIGTGIIPAGLEMMDTLAIRAAEDFIHAGYPVDAEAMLLCELDGYEAEVAHASEKVQAVMHACGAFDITIADDAAERARLWAGRKSAFPAVGRLAADYYCMDGTIPRARLPEVLQGIADLSQKYDLKVANVFHAGDGNLHPLILYDANQPGELERTEAFGGDILKLCVDVGGVITGEHGVGAEKLDQMCIQFGRLELKQFHAIKAALDPEGRMNPGKAVPTLHRCAELGAMHVHGGNLPHPELERF